MSGDGAVSLTGSSSSAFILRIPAGLTCEGDAKFNGFYGHGIVDALDAVVG